MQLNRRFEHREPHRPCWPAGWDGYERFIQANFLMLGYEAWRGFEALGTGLVVCSLAGRAPDANFYAVDPHWGAISARVDRLGDSYWDVRPFTLRFFPEFSVPDLMGQWGMERGAIAQILPIFKQYDPQREMITALVTADVMVAGSGDGAVDVTVVGTLASSQVVLARPGLPPVSPALPLILRLQNLDLGPMDCHAQVCQRWEEFMINQDFS